MPRATRRDARSAGAGQKQPQLPEEFAAAQAKCSERSNADQVLRRDIWKTRAAKEIGKRSVGAICVTFGHNSPSRILAQAPHRREAEQDPAITVVQRTPLLLIATRISGIAWRRASPTSTCGA